MYCLIPVIPSTIRFQYLTTLRTNPLGGLNSQRCAGATRMALVLQRVPTLQYGLLSPLPKQKPLLIINILYWALAIEILIY